MSKTNDPTQEPFRNYKLVQEKKDSGETFTVWISAKERKWLNTQKRLLRQPKDSTAIKQLAKIGADLLGNPSQTRIIDTVFKNKSKNKRNGVEEIG